METFSASKARSEDASQLKYRRRLQFLFVAHSAVTLAAGVVLVLAPGFIPGLVGIRIEGRAELIGDLLAAAEFGFAVLSLGATRLRDPAALRLAVWTLITFHLASGILESVAFLRGGNVVLLANVIVRIVISGLFFLSSRKIARSDGAGPPAKNTP